MIVLDTDIISLLFTNHARVADRYRMSTDDVVITVVSRIEVLQGRFATLLKTADGSELQQAQARLDRADRDLSAFRVLPIDPAAATEFDRLKQDQKLKKIGRSDLPIASIALAHRAILVTRNTKHYRVIRALQLENWAD